MTQTACHAPPPLHFAVLKEHHELHIWPHNPGMQIALLLAETHNNMILMADDDDNIHTERTYNNNSI